MRDQRAQHGAADLADHVERRIAGRKLAPEGHDQRHRRVEMCARERRQDADEHDEDGTGGDGIGEQGQADIGGQALGHDARADHGGDENGGAECFGGQWAETISHYWPCRWRHRACRCP
ncbi:hypothetical protein D3C87_1685710 [compost metagenome]